MTECEWCGRTPGFDCTCIVLPKCARCDRPKRPDRLQLCNTCREEIWASRPDLDTSPEN